MDDKDPAITWEIAHSLVTNPNIIKAWLKAMGAVYLLCLCIMLPIFAGTGEWDAIPAIFLIFLTVCAAIFVVGLLIMMLILGNRSKARFTVSPRGVEYLSLDKRVKGLSRLAVAAGGLFGSPSTAGAGMLSVSRESIHLDWSGIFTAVFDENNRTIRLRNSYRDLLHLYCTKENFEPVKQLVENFIKKNKTQAPVKPGRVLFRGIGTTVLVLTACLPLYALTDMIDLHLMSGILITAFGLATVWMVPLFGWVVLAVELYVLGWMVIKLTESRTLKLVNTYQFRGYETLDAGEWLVLALAVIGMIYLAWLSIRAVRGKLLPVLMQD